jgi:hypothetical protein
MIVWYREPKTSCNWVRRRAKNLTELKVAIKKDALKSDKIAIQGSKHTVIICAWSQPGKIKIGCQRKTATQWLKLSEAWAKRQGYSPTQKKEYTSYVKLLSKIKLSE